LIYYRESEQEKTGWEDVGRGGREEGRERERERERADRTRTIHSRR
jgi:hypothetical protein